MSDARKVILYSSLESPVWLVSTMAMAFSKCCPARAFFPSTGVGSGQSGLRFPNDGGILRVEQERLAIKTGRILEVLTPGGDGGGVQIGVCLGIIILREGEFLLVHFRGGVPILGGGQRVGQVVGGYPGVRGVKVLGK